MKTLVLAVVGLLASGAWALPEAPFDALKVSIPKSTHKSQNRDYNFEGIVKLSNCSGSLVTFSGMPAKARAIVMTNGHCIQKPGGYLNPGEVWVNRPIKRAMKIFDAQMKLHPIEASKILYATMTNTDVAYYELTKSYEEIKNETGVRPLLMDANRPLLNESIEIISGYWDRGWSCDIAAFVFRMKEGDWTWTDSIRYTKTCDTMGGTSGSPLIAKGERRVVGINNTSNTDGAICTLNNPCEVSEDGTISAFKDVRYGQQTYNAYLCLTPDFRFDLSLSQCDLPR